MAEQADTPAYRCTQCGVGLKGKQRKYCGKLCAWTAASRRIGKRPMAEQRAEQYVRTHRQCPECKRMYRLTRHDNHSKGRQVYCSLRCAHAETHRRAAIEREAAVYRHWSLNAKRRQRQAEAARYAKPCHACGAIIEGRWATLCSPCRLERAAAGKRAARARGKAMLRAATVETFDPVEVLTRDAWRCHICGAKTPKRLRGSFDDRAPELDHIIPLAAGGEHSRRNTACACRKCNIAKADRPLGQLRLIA